jgi:hypothetical protein
MIPIMVLGLPIMGYALVTISRLRRRPQSLDHAGQDTSRIAWTR